VSSVAAERLGEHCMYARAMGAAFRSLPYAVRRAHADRDRRVLVGRATVRRGAGTLGSLAGWLYGFPPALHEAPCRVEFETTRAGERWWRRFGGSSMSSLLTFESGRLRERFGRLVCELSCVKRGTRLVIRAGRARFAGVPLPRWLSPEVIASETEHDGRFVFRVHIRIPALGLIAAYRGTLQPV
jgi:hypothetical protein